MDAPRTSLKVALQRLYTPSKALVSELNGLRAIAVLMVLYSHTEALTNTKTGTWIHRLLRPGEFGVDIFFVLSGFLITRILLVDRERNAPLSHFLIRRGLRIFPIYFLVIGAVALVRYRPDVPWAALYLSNFYYAWWDHISTPLGHTWSLCVEEHFYLFWPVLIYFTSPRTSRTIALCLIPFGVALAIATAMVPDQLPVRALVYRGTMYRAASLAAGSLMAFYEPLIRQLGARVLTVTMPVAVAALLLARDQFGLLLNNPLYWVGKMVGWGTLAACIMLSVLALAGSSTAPLRLLRANWLGFIGKISYGLYLYHVPIYFWLGAYGPNQNHAPSQTALAVVTVCAVSVVSYYAIERPLLKFGEGFRSAEPKPKEGELPSAA